MIITPDAKGTTHPQTMTSSALNGEDLTFPQTVAVEAASTTPSTEDTAAPKAVPANGGGNGLRPPVAQTEAAEEPEFDIGKYAYRAPGGGVVKREQLVIPEGRPKDTFFRIDPRPEMQMPVSIFEYAPAGQLSKDTYLLTPDVADYLGHRAKHAIIRVCMCRPAVMRLWAVKVPEVERGQPNGYVTSAWEALHVLEKLWACLVMNESRTGYDVLLAETQWPEPMWRDGSIASLIAKAYRGRFVDNLDHELIQKLRGRI
jgi:hypothetical protein